MDNQQDYGEIPFQYICPITHYVMIDPVITFDGHTFERSAIQKWLNSHPTNPLTNKPLQSTKLIPNRSLKSLICSFIKNASGDQINKINSKMDNIFKNIFLQMSQKLPHLVDDFGMADIKKIDLIYKQNITFRAQIQKLQAEIKNHINQCYHFFPQFCEGGKLNFISLSKALKSQKSLQQKIKQYEKQINLLREQLSTEQQQKKIIMNIMSATNQNSVTTNITQAWYDSAAKSINQLTVPPTKLFIHITESNPIPQHKQEVQ